MRVLLEILLIAMLAFVGWRQPFRDAVRARLPNLDIAPSRLALLTLKAEHYARQGKGSRHPSARGGSWMYDEARSLDRPPTPGR